MEAFIKTLICGNSTIKDPKSGILGMAKAYYGCVEAQGRGTLHCHMVVWVEGGLNPSELQDKIRTGGDEFRQRLIAFLDDTISTSVPQYTGSDPSRTEPIIHGRHERHSVRRPHPSSVRGLPLNFDQLNPGKSYTTAANEDLIHLVTKNQTHKHSRTCYKYCAPDGPQVCRFDLDPANIVSETRADADTGELTLRCLDGMVNNFNATILRALRCNMDIQFIGSGYEAKAILYYITDYVTKSPLKSHIAYAALELAVKRLESVHDTGAPSPSLKAKRLLHKCAFALVANQELSGQQVASYLQGYDDRFTSHSFRNLYWPSAERYLDRLSPSPECSYISHSKQADDPGPDYCRGDADQELADDLEERDDMDEDDDIVVGHTDNGELYELGSQLTDYLYR
ncbi:hypothetical protein C8Q76DRAFT_586624, partial [Earliella scabrosa]